MVVGTGQYVVKYEMVMVLGVGWTATGEEGTETVTTGMVAVPGVLIV
jgi:hypothetical protein